MKRTRIIGLLLLCFVVILCSYSASVCAAAASAPPPSGKSQSGPALPAQPSAPKAPAFDPNAPAQGSITITMPAVGAEWYAGGYDRIEWTCNGTKSNLVDVSIWKDGKQVAVISSNVATGRTGYTSPIGMRGDHEIRIVSQSDTRVEARQKVRVKQPEIRVIRPNTKTLFAGTSSLVTWEYKGNPGPVNVALKNKNSPDPNFPWVTMATNISPGTSGAGGVAWTVPQERQSGFYIEVWSVATQSVSGTMGFFDIRPYGIVVLPTEDVHWDKPFTISWTYDEGMGGPVKIDLVVPEDGRLAYNVTPNTPIGSGGKGSFTWTIPDDGHCPRYLTTLVTYLASGATSKGSFTLYKLPRKPHQAPDDVPSDPTGCKHF